MNSKSSTRGAWGMCALIMSACAADIDSDSAQSDRSGMETTEPAQEPQETRVAVVIATAVPAPAPGAHDTRELPIRPPSIIGTYCVDLGDPNAEVTGEEILKRVSAEYGVEIAIRPDSLVCQIEGYGCPLENCFCADAYWSYWTENAATREWAYAELASRLRVLHPGDMDGWSWLPYDPPTTEPDAALPPVAFDDVCPHYRAYLPVTIH
ncbi:MAG: hypothetical protein H6715_06315 [Myxococcales bacterium]|nr:hypothetical protein [Myxococcales bacterium]MCB9709189.1 hypothetical protein [Myxococcales bacterium]